MPFETYDAAREAEERRKFLQRQRDLGNPQSRTPEEQFQMTPGAMVPSVDPNQTFVPGPPTVNITTPSDVVNRQMEFAPSQNFLSAEEEERNRQRAAQMEAMQLDATLRAQQEAAAARGSGGFGFCTSRFL